MKLSFELEPRISCGTPIYQTFFGLRRMSHRIYIFLALVFLEIFLLADDVA
jgi:hypothetical protein